MHMMSVICPYCKTGIGILFDQCLHDLMINGQSSCMCTGCNHTFIVFTENGKIKTKYDNSTFYKLDKDCDNNE